MFKTILLNFIQILSLIYYADDNIYFRYEMTCVPLAPNFRK